MKHRLMFACFFGVFVFLTIPSAVLAAVIWCNPGNKGSCDGTTRATGYRTLWQAMATMSPNDELIIVNGDWRQMEGMTISDADHMPPDGADGYTRVRAETDWGVKLPHIHIDTGKPHGFMEFRGFVFDNRFMKNGAAHHVYNMHHTKFIRCGFLAHGLKGNNHCMGFGNSDYNDRSKSSYNLMEECIAWGSGRYMLISWNGEKNIFRRCLVRHDYNDAQQIFNFRAYACDQTIYQNCISIDSDRIEHYAKPLSGESGGFWVGDQYGANGNVVDGCISIKDIQLPYYISGSEGKGQNVVKDSIALDVTVPGEPTLSAFVLKSNTNVIASNLLGIKAFNKSQDGFYGKKGGTLTVADSILRDVGNVGLRANQTANNNHYQAGQCVLADRNKGLAKLKGMFFCWGSGSTDYDPLQNGLKYPVRIEQDSPLASAGQDGERCGPEILKKIGVSGTLYGEPGWDKVTDENLWPFPNEKKIWELMRETVDGVSGIYGFCGDWQTLTNYIWGYFGNTVPPFNVQAIPGDGTVSLSWDAPPEITLKTITGFNVYEVKNGARTLMGGTVTGNQTYSKTISGLVSGRQYEFAVASIDKAKGESGLSYIVKVIPKRIEELSPKKTVSDKTARTGKNVDDSADPSVKDLPVGTEKKNDDVVRVEASPAKKFTNRLGMKFVLISPGTFEMGLLSDGQNQTNGAAPHRVVLTKGFYMQETEVSQGQWKALMGADPSFFKNCGGDCPVEQVSWNETQVFIEKLNDLEKTDVYRLPTEAEWEYACRAGTKTPFSFGECLSTAHANYCGHYPLDGCEKGLYREKPVSMKEFSPNEWGLTGMYGNVWEWCQDWFGPYSGGVLTDPKGPSSGKLRVFRGGGWNSYAKACRSGNRGGAEPAKYFANLGFRLVKEP
ncbi:MAG TPA: SUMF1/EgtB/PvdO family nonheme iron enzyme [Deltaproteobacteria bacterium]|nr:SUMF1/EgtB/PvdO family nonheme iron enzyme [Deltaproteobacteria bacterium]